MVKVLKFIIPTGYQNVQNYYPNTEEPEDIPMSEVYEDPIFEMNNAVLQLMESQQNNQILTVVK